MSLPRALSVLLLTPAMCFAHPGGLDSKGGHHDRKNGGYHYHRSTTAALPAEPPRQSSAKEKAEPSPTATDKNAVSTQRPAENLGVFTPAVAPSRSSPLAQVTIGMTKAEVQAKIGPANILSDDSWFYSKDGWVRFRAGAVYSIEAK